MYTLHDYLPSQNGYKVRLLLHHLGIAYRTRLVSIFEGEGQEAPFLAMNPTGAVPVLELEDGRTLAESNAILAFLAEGTPYLPSDPWSRAQVHRWMYFEEDYIQNGLATLRHWTLTGKIARRDPALVDAKRATSLKSLAILDRWLAGRTFIATESYGIADISLYAYVSRSGEAGIALDGHAAVAAWVARVRAQPGFLDEVHAYSIDPASTRDLPG